jgi:hypothetical protein
MVVFTTDMWKTNKKPAEVVTKGGRCVHFLAAFEVSEVQF